ncbi:glycosyltransferase involved in cell wall biosynthesis [Nocardioides marinisabuli]|uniref:Glycosyltransferase involved in cell wall biosynthesis n=1 Tax=Nocardioides marinisabuli TaxID=419476 RepID=A0A7Y9F6H6_9ACTN|nr:glycosyltransferase family 4 protein [Nocardioides marinisabuli]NYD59510.1 glycosyltransferase involved in cell wall biosynthesis [Nocardioides marinisabuli]
MAGTRPAPRVVQVLTQEHGGPVDHAVDVAVGLAARGVDSHVVGPPGPGTARAEGAGVVWHRVAAASKLDLRGLVRLARRLRALRPDVLHLQDRRAGWVGRALAPALPGTRVVYTLHGVPDSLSDLVRGNLRVAPRRRRDRLYYLHGERWSTRWSRAVVVSPSAAVAAYAVEHVGLDPDRVRVVPNGVDPARFAPAPTLRERPDGLVVAWMGSLEPVKGLDVLVEALAGVEGVRVLLAGDGPSRGLLAERLRHGALADRVEVLGRVEAPEQVLARADALVMTSLAESCPLVLLQALSSGLPVVATTVGGVVEVVRHGREGLLVAPGRPAAVTAALAVLRDDPGRRAAMGAAARERVLTAYTLEHCLDGLEAVYAGEAPCAC